MSWRISFWASIVMYFVQVCCQALLKLLRNGRHSFVLFYEGKNLPYDSKMATGSTVVECLTRDREVTGSSLTCVTVLCP